MINKIENVYKDIQKELSNNRSLPENVKKLFEDFLKIDKNNDNEIISQLEKICSQLKKVSFTVEEYWTTILERIKGENNSYVYAAVYIDDNEENHTLGLFSKKEDAVNCIENEVNFEFTKNRNSFLYDECVCFYDMYDEEKTIVAMVYKIRLNINKSGYYSVLGARD